MAEIINAAPQVVDLGTRDADFKVVPEGILNFPQHLPKVYIFAEKGPVGPTYVDFDNITLTGLYGDSTFDPNSKYYTHQSVFLQTIAGNANNCVVHRLMGPDVNDVANIALYLDVLPAQVPLYKKRSDGSLVLDDNGDPVQETDSSGDPITVAGYKVMWVTDYTSTKYGTYQRGLLTQRNGVQTDGTNQSVQYPIFEFAAKDTGEYGNKLAIRMYPALQTDIIPFPDNILNTGKMYPFYFKMVKVVDPISGATSSIFNSFNSEYTKFVTKVSGIDPASGSVIDLTKTLEDQYINIPDNIATGLGTVYVYQNNLGTVSQMLYDAEKIIADPARDSVINTEENNIHALNIISFTSSNGSPYQALKLVNEPGSVRLTKHSNLFLRGGDDGTISDELLDRLVAIDLDKYADPLDSYNDAVSHPESVIYDSGFTIETKKKFPKFISRRKDTFVVLSTFARNAQSISLADQYSVAVALSTMMELYPESATFGTSVMRGIVMGGSGTLINSLYNKRVPVSLEVADKASKYMGAKNGKWKSGLLFDKAPNSILRLLKDIDITWIPAGARNTLWSVGLNFPHNYKAGVQYLPGIQTVYKYDSSVLNSFFSAIAISYLNKVQHAAHREFSGSISLTNAQLVERVNAFIADNTKGKFDDLFVIIPETTVTGLDELRGYSWTSNIKFYANNMKTVMTAMVEAYRMSDLA